MNEKKYAKLLSDATALNAQLNFSNGQINSFSSTCNKHCMEVNANLNDMQQDLQKLGSPPLAKEKEDILHNMQTSLSKMIRTFKNEIEKPCQQYQKSLDQIEERINKINRDISIPQQGSNFDFKPIRQLIEQAKSQIKNTRPQIDGCYQQISKLQISIANIEQQMEDLDLPHEIEHITKDLEKINRGLGAISLQFSNKPESRRQYQKEFLPLLNALHNLQSQSLAFDLQASQTASSANETKLKL